MDPFFFTVMKVAGEGLFPGRNPNQADAAALQPGLAAQVRTRNFGIGIPWMRKRIFGRRDVIAA